MTATIETSRRSGSYPGKKGPAERRRDRDMQAVIRERRRDDARQVSTHVQQAARQRHEGAQERTREQRRNLELLRRGAGVSQILQDIGRPNDTLSISLARALHLRRLLDAVAARYPQAGGVEIESRDLDRIVAHLDGRIRLLQEEEAQQKLKRSGRRSAHKGRGRPRAARQPMPATRG